MHDSIYTAGCSTHLSERALSGQVKDLLGEGACLQRPMLHALLDAVSAFVHGCGLARFNRFALPLLGFVRKCAGVAPEDFDAMVSAARLVAVLSSLLPPPPRSSMPIRLLSTLLSGGLPPSPGSSSGNAGR